VKVLVIDDSATVRSRLVALLGEVGGVDEVLQAETASDGLASAVKSAPRVIVLDLHLREDSGLALLPELRREARDAVLVVLTNHASDLHRRRCEERGADYFLDKSNDFDRIVEIVASARADTQAAR
jgi:DNA-binding NarL/FixJ family response regulator